MTAANKKINRPHFYLTVKREVERGDVLRDLKDTFSLDDPEEYIEILVEPEREPNFKLLVGGAVPGGRLLCGRRNDPNPMRAPAEDEKVKITGAGTISMFCRKNEQHYALTCFHVGATTDRMRLWDATNQKENIREIRRSLQYSEERARSNEYFFEEDIEQNDNVGISFGNNGNRTFLGNYHNYCFDSNCDIMSVKVSDDIHINYPMLDALRPDWEETWDELYDRVIENPGQDLVKVEKICLFSNSLSGRILDTVADYDDENGLLFEDITIVKGDAADFLEKGESGSLMCFLDKNGRKRAFAYGVMEVDEITLPERHEELPGPFIICLCLQTALERLGLAEARCFIVRGGNRESRSVSSGSSRCDIL